MAKEILMPKLGMTMEKGKIVRWLVKIGDKVDKGDPIVEVETDKVTLEVEALDEGYLLEILADAETEVPVNQPIAYLGELGEKVPTAGNVPVQDGAPSTVTETKAEEGRTSLPKAFANDVLIIGAGPGGYVAAIRAAQLGAKVTLVEKGDLGGTCLNRGCIPTKVLAKNAEMWRFVVHDVQDMGISVTDPSFHWPKIMDRKDSVVARLVDGVRGLLKKNRVETIRGVARVVDKHTVEVKLSDGGSTQVQARHLVLATGTVPADTPFAKDPGVETMTTDEVLSLSRLPESLVIIGGGVIGSELASIFASFGVEVSIVEIMPRLLPTVDGELAQVLEDEFTRNGVKVLTGVRVKKVERTGGRQHLVLSDDRVIEAERVLLAVGRRPETSAYESLNLKVTKQGYVEIDERMRTSVDGVLAVGDITGKMPLAHVAMAQGIVAAENLFGRERSMSYDAVPNCVFTCPEIAFVGLTEEQAKANKIPYAKFKFPFSASGKAVAIGNTKGFVKIISDTRWGEILGVHVVGPEATSLIAEAAVAMKLEATVEELAHVIHAHPTLSEAVMEAAGGLVNAAIHV